jgi:hypothetical protein
MNAEQKQVSEYVSRGVSVRTKLRHRRPACVPPSWITPPAWRTTILVGTHSTASLNCLRTNLKPPVITSPRTPSTPKGSDLPPRA